MTTRSVLSALSLQLQASRECSQAECERRSVLDRRGVGPSLLRFFPDHFTSLAVHVQRISMAAQSLSARLLLLVERGDAESLRSALAASGSPSMHANTVFTAERVSLLHVACARGMSAVAAILLAAGAQVRAKDTGGVTPLHRAACEGHAGVVELLLSSGAQHGERDLTGAVALHDAAFHGHADAAVALLRAGCDARTCSDDGASALHYACVCGSLQVAQALLEHGAVADARAVELATQHGHEQLAALLAAPATTKPAPAPTPAPAPAVAPAAVLQPRAASEEGARELAALKTALAGAQEEARLAKAQTAAAHTALALAAASQNQPPAAGEAVGGLSPGDCAAIAEAMRTACEQASTVWRAAALAAVRARRGEEGGATAREVALLERLSEVSEAEARAQRALSDAQFAAETARSQLALRREAEGALMEREEALTARLAGITVDRDALRVKLDRATVELAAAQAHHAREIASARDEASHHAASAAASAADAAARSVAQEHAAHAARAAAAAASTAAATTQAVRDAETAQALADAQRRAEQLAQIERDRDREQERERERNMMVEEEGAPVSLEQTVAHDSDVAYATRRHPQAGSPDSGAAPAASAFLAPLKPRKAGSPRPHPLAASPAGAAAPERASSPAASTGVPSPASGARRGRSGGGGSPGASAGPTPANTPEHSRAPSPVPAHPPPLHPPPLHQPPHGAPLPALQGGSPAGAAAAAAAAQARSLEASSAAAAGRLASKLAAWDLAKTRVQRSRSVSRERSRSSSRESRPDAGDSDPVDAFLQQAGAAGLE